ncbi:hypothetical protein [Bradyrhizobium sp. BR 10289]|uniref:hypothetical protein n=1 Tax=Bradyrhizobium sp. BR 10289 TaxID=2749993 RepID=UPI001C651EC0|nr:hypothetical protein [Bradyrhizobium sp. BR 10289]MBW7968603.1 hypothetical protein [Bradyrhizobium sp. BR 10289]
MKHVPPPTGEPVEALDSFAALAAAVHPDWHKAILRLAKATERVEKRIDEMGLCKTPLTFQRKMRQMVDDLLVLLDGMDDDPDLEPTAGGSCDDECEPDQDGEPSLGWTTSGLMGDVNDLELDDCDREDDDPNEEKQQAPEMCPSG